MALHCCVRTSFHYEPWILVCRDVRASRVRLKLSVAGPTVTHTCIAMRNGVLAGGDFEGSLHVWDVRASSGGPVAGVQSDPDSSPSGTFLTSVDLPSAASPSAASSSAATACLMCTARHKEWVRSVALYGAGSNGCWGTGGSGGYVISSSKDGRVRVSLRETLAVLHEWDLNAEVALSAERECELSTPSSIAAQVTCPIPVGGCFCPEGGSGTDGDRNPVNQAFAVVADRWGIVVGCQDCSIRLWHFAPGGVLPEAEE